MKSIRYESESPKRSIRQTFGRSVTLISTDKIFARLAGMGLTFYAVWPPVLNMYGTLSQLLFV